MVHAHRLQQQVDRRGVDRRAGREQPQGHRYRQDPSSSARMARQLFGSQAARAGEGVREQAGTGHLLFPPRRARKTRHPGACRHLRHQPRRRRVPGNQPDHPPRPQELQHRRGRRGYRQRHEPERLLRSGGRRTTHRGHPPFQGGSSGERQDPLRRDRVLPGPCSRKKPRCWTPSRSTWGTSRPTIPGSSGSPRLPSPGTHPKRSPRSFP